MSSRGLSDEIPTAHDAIERQLQLGSEHGSSDGVGEAWPRNRAIAAIAAIHRRDEVAEQLRGAARQWTWPSLSPDDHVIEERLDKRCFNSARTRHGTKPWRMSEQRGAQMSFQQATAYALHESSILRTAPASNENPNDAASTHEAGHRFR